ncbi:MAG: YcaO-like family protein [Symploca sp. SIO1C4]|uniref:YcaO-like family protein n=1 Tax=Symploca sp. SIO1C4 TaxID=2607765 RepID=A0A6B3NCT3_9CYAN|nr:YcaO-like family protein [Symploca sp. SIO1C4]
MTFINFRNQAYYSAKRYWHGTHRSAAVGETWERVRSYFKSIGLTRIANITGLDWIGIPVTISYRPNSCSVVTSSGKGITLETAMVSAAMESTELYCAENINLPEINLPYSQLAANYQVIARENLPLCENSLFNIYRSQQWCLGWDIVNQWEVAVPVQAVSMNYHKYWLQYGANLGSFDMNSNGLASGNNFLEALNSALYEVIERDAVSCQLEACLQGQGLPQGYRLPRVCLETIEYPLVLKLLTKLESAKIVPVIFDCTVDTEIPVYRAYIYDPSGHAPSSHGYGAHLDPEVAMVRALSEAAQTRLILISGARDDIYHHYYTALKIKGNGSYEAGNLESNQPTVDARTRKSQATPTFEEDITIVLEKLKQAGLNQVIVFDLTPPDWDISVVRVIVPGLEASFHRGYRPKQRAIAFGAAPKALQTS